MRAAELEAQCLIYVKPLLIAAVTEMYCISKILNLI